MDSGRVIAELTALYDAAVERLRGDIAELMPRVPEKKNGKRIACIGAGPASLTVANDLMPLGYEVTIFEKQSRPGGLMRSNIPSFRLPEAVLQQEIDLIELRDGHVHAFEIKYSPGKKFKIPSAFSKTYPEASFERIAKDNYFSWIT